MSHQRKPTLQPVSSPVLPQEAEQETKRSKKETSEELTEAIQKLDTTDNNEQQKKTTTATLASAPKPSAAAANRSSGGFVFSEAFFQKAERRWDCGVEYRSMGQETSNGMMGKEMDGDVEQTVGVDGHVNLDTRGGNVEVQSKKGENGFKDSDKVDKLCDSRSDESSSEQRDADNTMNETTEFVDLERKETKHKETGDNDTPTKTPKNKATMDVKQPVPVRNKQDKVMEKKYLDWVYDDGELGPLRDHQARMGSMIALREWTDEGIAWREFCEARGGRGELV